MYSPNSYNTNNLPISFMSDHARNRRNSNISTYFDAPVSPFYTNPGNVTKVAPAPGYHPGEPHRAFENQDTGSGGLVYRVLKPVLYLQRYMGIYPISISESGRFEVTSQLLMYSALVFLVEVAFIGYIKWDKVEIVRSSETEAKFEEAVIDYLFTVYLIPIVMNPITLYEAKYHANIMNDFKKFEEFYRKVVKKKLNLFVGNKSLLLTIALPVVSCATMVVNHITMVNFRFVQVIPYCYINTVTYLVGGLWFAYSDVIGNIALTISQDFQFALKNMSTSSRIAEFRTLWMLLARITRDCGNSSGHTLIFLSLYLFLIITLTIYGLFSQIQGGFELKDIGLTITAVFAVALLYFICDEAHYASNCVKVHFQKRLLLVELTWMNEDAQQEINMFLRATEMNPTNMSLVGFFDVNRNLFKSLLATMVTYLVVLLQFQISIPEDNGGSNVSSNMTKS
ncbi:gustatory and odorant receptor 24 [Harmonia axyridis]|uniref:gustatory and odorant receptor 24 n=1 Tax=Harmonia axyridis TaxID=115357 RepID=UPI001E2787FC|nr:gustatory and odorant receptor 24 [Harmonia axyridis]